MELLTDDIIIEALDSDGIMQEPDANWLMAVSYTHLRAHET